MNYWIALALFLLFICLGVHKSLRKPAEEDVVRYIAGDPAEIKAIVNLLTHFHYVGMRDRE